MHPYGASPRQPLLPARQRRARKRPSRTGYIGAFLLAAAAVLLTTAILVYVLLPAEKNDGGAQQALDSEEELRALHTPSKEYCALQRPPRVCAHGGDGAAAPPNTLRAFQVALDGSADCLEVDVSMTRDGQLVVLHDRELATLLGVEQGGGTRRGLLAAFSSGSGSRRVAAPPRVGDYTWEQLAYLEWDGGGDRVPTLQSVLSAALPRGVALTIDVKLGDGAAADALAQAVVDALAAAGCGAACMVWAKSDALVATVKDLNRAQRVGLVVVNDTAAARAAGMHRPMRLPGVASVLGVHYQMATAELARQVRDAGLELHVWTANSAAMMRAALDVGPDAVVTNHPGKLREAVEARQLACQARKQ